MSHQNCCRLGKNAPTAELNRTIVSGDYSNVFTSDNEEYLIKYVDGNTVLSIPGISNASGSITLSDNIDVEIGFTLDGAVEDYEVSYTFIGEENDIELTDKNVVVKVDNIYAFQMADEIEVSVYYKGSLVDTKVFSVKKYCEYQINNSNSESLINLCKAILNYGASAQTYFNGKSYNGGAYVIDMTNLANKDVDTEIVEAEKPSNTKNQVGDLGGVVTDVTYTLVVGSEVSMKFYIYTNRELDLDSLIIGCSPSKETSEVLRESAGRYSIKVNGIKASELGTDYTITLSEGGETMTITYSPYAYAASKWDNGNNLADLCRKLVTYGEATQIY